MADDRLAIGLLGPVEISGGGKPISAGRTLRAVLAMLALRAGEPIASDALVAGIWGETDEPLAGSGQIQVSVSRIRALLGPRHATVLRTVAGGYVLGPEGLLLDIRVFEQEMARGREELAASRPEEALEHLDAALGLWRGPALMDVADFPFAAHVADRFEELRVDAAEERFAARLAIGEHHAIVGEVQELLALHPYRERLAHQLMVALYRGGQPASALAAFTAFRTRLVLDLGVEPGEELQRLQQHILARDPGIAGPKTSAQAREEFAVPGPAPGQRLPSNPVLFGRETLLTELESLAMVERLITLTGPGGSGKTAVAVALLHRLASSFPDGTYFVDLAGETRPSSVLPAIAAALGISQSGTPLRVRLAEVLAERRVLMVLDNFEHLTEAVPDLVPLIGAAKGGFVATSRRPLGLKAEHLVAVLPLPVPDASRHDVAYEPAVQLFLRTATNAGGDLGPGDLDDVSRICRAVDGLPLAIELAAAQTRFETVRELAEGIADRMARMVAQSRDVPDRQRTMDAAISWSIEGLPQFLRDAFGVLAVFSGAFDVTGAAALLKTDRGGAIDVLSSLLDASLLQRDPSHGGEARFRMLEPLRAVARIHAPSATWEETTDRHADFIAGEIDRLSPMSTGVQQPEALSQLRADQMNVMAALQHLLSADPDRAVDLFVQLLDFWTWTGQEASAVELLGAAIADERLSAEARSIALSTRAILDARFGRAGAATQAVGAALRSAHGLEHPAVLARLRLAEAFLALMEADRARANTAATHALAFARRTRQPWLIGNCASIAAYCNLFPIWYPGPDEARQIESWLQEGLSAATDAPAPLTEINLRLTLMHYLVRVKQDRVQAEGVARSALDIARRFDSPELAAAFANHLGLLAVRRGSVSEGRLLILSALQTLVRIGPRVDALAPLGSMAEVEASLGHWRNALILSHVTTGLARKMGDVRMAVLDPEEEAAIAEAEQHLGSSASDEARRSAEAMTYAEAVRFAFAVNGMY